MSGEYGNRRLSAFENAVTLPVVYFNNADIALNLATAHFNFYCTAQDLSCLTEFSTKVEGSYTRIVNALEANVTTKIDIFFFKDLASYHCAAGYPEWSEWGSGASFGKALILMASPNNAGPAGYNGQLEVIVHEFVHSVVDWKTVSGVTNWLNEGIATYLADQTSDRTTINGNGLNKVLDVPGGSGFVLIDSTDLKPGKTYTLKGERSDGTDTVHASDIVFTVPGTDGIVVFSNLFSFNCYPVPVVDVLTLETVLATAGNIRVDVFSITGQLMYTNQKSTSGSLIRKVDMRGYPSGTYFVKVTVKTAAGLSEIRTIKINR